MGAGLGEQLLGAVHDPVRTIFLMLLLVQWVFPSANLSVLTFPIHIFIRIQMCSFRRRTLEGQPFRA